MISNNLLQQLQSENELLQLQLQDVNEMIKVREDELEILRKTAAHAVMLQSRLDINNEMSGVSSLYKEIASLNGQVSELKSNLEIAHLEMENMEEQLAKYKASNALVEK